MEWKEDKTKHACISFLLVILLYILTKNVDIAMVGALTVGIAKEVYDEFWAGPGSHWDKQDMVADIIGIVFGGIICHLI